MNFRKIANPVCHSDWKGQGFDDCTPGGSPEMAVARKKVDAAKVGLGEHGPVWWDDGAPDFSRYLAKTTPYLEWSEKLTMESRPLYHRHNPWGGEINAINSSFVEVF